MLKVELASPALVERCLVGVKYPADKNTLLRHIKQTCPTDLRVFNTVEKLSYKAFTSPMDLSKTIKNIKL